MRCILLVRGRQLYKVKYDDRETDEKSERLLPNIDLTDSFERIKENYYYYYSEYLKGNTAFKIKSSNNNTISSLKASRTLFRPYQFKLMNEKKYSIYLNELWQKWRVLYQSSKGASKNSEIPNWIYNDYRNVCCSTILSYIEGHPDDIMAINEFLVMACKENVLRYGVFEYGNQYVVEKYYLFSKKVEV